MSSQIVPIVNYFKLIVLKRDLTTIRYCLDYLSDVLLGIFDSVPALNDGEFCEDVIKFISMFHCINPFL